MVDNDHAQADRELDAALAKYAAVEPRAGLEERVLANLRAQEAGVRNHAWWRWSVAVALAAVVVAVLIVGWRSGKSSRPVIVNHPSTPAPGANAPRTKVAANGGAKQLRPAGQGSNRAATVLRPQPTVVAGVSPKLDQFPSPQPLSEQETILQNYVAQYPEQALLLARARSEALRRDQFEEIQASPSGDQASDSDERSGGTTER